MSTLRQPKYINASTAAHLRLDSVIENLIGQPCHVPKGSGKTVSRQGKAVERQWTVKGKAVDGQGKAVEWQWAVKERQSRTAPSGRGPVRP